MNPVNPRIRSWLRSGLAVDALVGGQGFFIPGVMFSNEHDRILIVNQLLTWAEDENEFERAADAVEGAIERLLREGDIAGAVDIVWTYVLVVDDRGVALPLGQDVLLSTINGARSTAPQSAPTKLLDEIEDRLLATPDPSTDTGHADPPKPARSGE